MTDDLVEQLRHPYAEIAGMVADEAADRIEALTAENERLRNEMARILLVKQNMMNPIHTIHHMQRIARAALGDTQ